MSDKFKLKFNFQQLAHGNLELTGKVPASAFDIEDEELILYGDVEYALTIYSVSGGATMTGNVSVNLRCSCQLCLKKINLPIEIKDIYHFYEKDKKDEFDLIPDIREDILIALPLSYLCKRGCKGLCFICGSNLNLTDCDCKRTSAFYNNDAWKELNRLKTKKNKSEIKHGCSKKKKI
jgi:uncharacterized protein